MRIDPSHQHKKYLLYPSHGVVHIIIFGQSLITLNPRLSKASERSNPFPSFSCNFNKSALLRSIITVRNSCMSDLHSFNSWSVVVLITTQTGRMILMLTCGLIAVVLVISILL